MQLSHDTFISVPMTEFGELQRKVETNRRNISDLRNEIYEFSFFRADIRDVASKLPHMIDPLVDIVEVLKEENIQLKAELNDLVQQIKENESSFKKFREHIREDLEYLHRLGEYQGFDSLDILNIAQAQRKIDGSLPKTRLELNERDLADATEKKEIYMDLFEDRQEEDRKRKAARLQRDYKMDI